MDGQDTVCNEKGTKQQQQYFRDVIEYSLTTLYDLIVKRFAISVENPGAKQL